VVLREPGDWRPASVSSAGMVRGGTRESGQRGAAGRRAVPLLGLREIGQYLRVVTLEDRETVLNAFPDRSFKTMRLHYDAESDYLYVKVADREAAPDAEEILPGIVAGYDADGRLIGLEVEHASELFDLTEVDSSVAALPPQAPPHGDTVSNAAQRRWPGWETQEGARLKPAASNSYGSTTRVGGSPWRLRKRPREPASQGALDLGRQEVTRKTGHRGTAQVSRTESGQGDRSVLCRTDGQAGAGYRRCL